MDKYMRAAKAALRYIKEKGYCGVVENPYSSLTIAGLVKEELERPEPLIPGVRYRNTEANRGRLPFPLGSALIEKNKCFYAAINWFSDGGACPRCGSGESEVHPKPWQCDKCGAMHHTFHVRRTCNACNYSVTRVREDRDE